MRIDSFDLENWLNPACDSEKNKYYLGGSCVLPMTVEELFELTGEDMDAFMKDLAKMNLGYPRFEGTPQTRQAIADMYRGIRAEDVILCHGGTGANSTVCYGLLDPEDNIVSIMPNYQQFFSIPRSIGTEVRDAWLTPEAGYVLDMEELRSRVDQNTKAIMFTNPNNPTGALLRLTAAAAGTHGMIRKTGEELGDLRTDEVTIRLGAFRDGRMTGYLAYRFENVSETNFTQNRINVTELIHLDAETLTSFLEYLRRQADLVQSVKISSGDENFYHILSDPQDLSMEYLPYGYLQVSREFIGYMYKIVDYPEFFRLTANRPAGRDAMTARIEYEDAFAKAVRCLVIEAGGPRGGWRLLEQGTLAVGASAGPVGAQEGVRRLAPDAAGASADPTGASADVTIRCSESDLNALLMNAARLQPLYELGAVRTDDPAALRRLDAILYYSQKPYSNTDF